MPANPYEDYYVRQVGGQLPVFVGGRGQRGHGLGNIFGSLFRSAMPLIKRGALALGKRALKTGMHVARDVVAGGNLKESVKKRAKAAGTDLLDSLLNAPPKKVQRRRRVKKPRRVAPTVSRRKKRRRPDDIFDD
ncbi:hypothetical protein DJ031_00120 [bacterium endosymbiont of Escarpia laminata]|nr:MAG: hypothetical protein DJ031_00120 [bacterium endosymbiont of Escarpia laminata]